MKNRRIDNSTIKYHTNLFLGFSSVIYDHFSMPYDIFSSFKILNRQLVSTQSNAAADHKTPPLALLTHPSIHQ